MQPPVAMSGEPADLGEEHTKISSSPGWHGAHLRVAEAGTAGDFLGNGFLACLRSWWKRVGAAQRAGWLLWQAGRGRSRAIALSSR